MPTYSFTCSDCGPFDLTHSMTDLAATPPCPACAVPARRVFGLARLTAFSKGEHRLAAAAAASAENPAVTTTIPTALGRRRSPRRDPRLPALPKL